MTEADAPLLCEAYDVAVLDLDGVVYVGRHAVPGAPEALREAQDRGQHLAFVTNNASRTPAQVGAHLRELGIPAADEDVVTSAQAAARLVTGLVPAGSRVYVIGGTGLEEALRELALEPVTSAEPSPAAVVQGYGPDMPWRQVIAGAILVAEGLPWVASNLDATVPTSRGTGPGNGALVDLVARFADRRPLVAGKPAAPLFEETLLRVGGSSPLMVGDRLDTDIEGAVAVGWDSLLVMTGVTGIAELVSAAPEVRPTYVATGLDALLLPTPPPLEPERKPHRDGWRAEVAGGRLHVTGSGPVDAWWHVVAATAWQHLDDTGRAVAVDEAVVPGSVVP